MKREKKRADITVEQIVLWTFVAASFIAILFFLFRADLGGTTEDEVCHTSVVTRASASLLRETVPLNCKTSYICLSKDGSCEKMTSPEVVRVKTKEEIYKTLAEEGANCWWMFGEGEADYIGQGFTAPLYCSICSQVAFDDSLYNMFAVNPSLIARANLGIPESYSSFLINKEEFYEYLANTNMSGKDMTYMDYLLGLQNSQMISKALESNNYTFGYIDMEKQHLIMMGEFRLVGPFFQTLDSMKKGALMAFSVLPIPYVQEMAAALLVTDFYNSFIKKSGGYLLGTVMQGESGHAYLSPMIIEANSQDFNSLQCTDIKTLA